MSGDLHASYIVEEMRKKNENVEFFGVVGDKSIEAGVKAVNHIKNNDVIKRLKNNHPLSLNDIKYLEKVLWDELGTKEEYTKTYGKIPLLKMISKII